MRAALERIVEARAARRRERIAAAMAELGIEARVEGDAVRAQGVGLAVRWQNDLTLRDAGRDGL